MKRGHGRADYLLFVNRKAVGAIEAKKAGETLSGYLRGLVSCGRVEDVWLLSPERYWNRWKLPRLVSDTASWISRTFEERRLDTKFSPDITVPKSSSGAKSPAQHITAIH